MKRIAVFANVREWGDFRRNTEHATSNRSMRIIKITAALEFVWVPREIDYQGQEFAGFINLKDPVRMTEDDYKILDHIKYQCRA